MIKVFEIPDIEPEISAGSLSVYNNVLAFGTFNGFVIRKLPNLEILFENHQILPEHFDIHGVQLFKDSLIILFNKKSTSTERPADWQGCLQKISLDTFKVQAEYKMGPGNWRLVKGGEGTGKIILWDSSEDQGFFAIDENLSEIIWQINTKSLLRIDYTLEGGLTGIRCDRKGISINHNSGEIKIHEFHIEDFNCSFVTEFDDKLLAGGFTNNKENYVLLKFDNNKLQVKSIPLNTIFDPQKVVDILANEAFFGSYDLYEISHIVPINKRSALVTFGGMGVTMGVEGGTALGIIDLKTLNVIESIILDEVDSCSGIAKIKHGRYLINCYSSEYIVDIEL